MDNINSLRVFDLFGADEIPTCFNFDGLETVFTDNVTSEYKQIVTYTVDMYN